MAEIGPLTLSIITNTKPIEDAGRVVRKTANEIKRTFSDINRLNNSTLNTSNRQINEIQGQH